MTLWQWLQHEIKTSDLGQSKWVFNKISFFIDWSFVHNLLLAWRVILFSSIIKNVLESRKKFKPCILMIVSHPNDIDRFQCHIKTVCPMTWYCTSYNDQNDPIMVWLAMHIAMILEFLNYSTVLIWNWLFWYGWPQKVFKIFQNFSTTCSELCF